ncbi:hypothetical protein GCM10027511_19670 [Hymenobacter humi]
MGSRKQRLDGLSGEPHPRPLSKREGSHGTRSSSILKNRKPRLNIDPGLFAFSFALGSPLFWRGAGGEVPLHHMTFHASCRIELILIELILVLVAAFAVHVAVGQLFGRGVAHVLYFAGEMHYHAR